MSNNAQLNQVNADYKFRMAYVWETFRAMISASSSLEDEKVNSEVQEITKQHDAKNIDSLEKRMTTYVVDRGPKVRSANFGAVTNVKNKVQRKTSRESNLENTLKNDDEKEL